MSCHQEERTEAAKTRGMFSERDQCGSIENHSDGSFCWAHGTSTLGLPSTPALPADPIPVTRNSIKPIELRKTPRGATNSICQLNLLSARANGGERRVPD